MNETVAAGRRNPVKFAGHRSWFFDDSRTKTTELATNHTKLRQNRCRPVFRPEAENATQDSLRRKLRNSVSDWVGVSLWLQGQDVDVGVSSSLAVGVRCGGSDDGWNDRPSGEAL